MRKKSRKRDRTRVIIVSLCIAVLLLGLYRGGRWLETRGMQTQARGDLEQRYAQDDVVDADGSVWRKKKNVTSVLLMGVDRASDAVVSGFRNGGQADFLQLIVIDNEAGAVRQLQIDRDTMTPITILGVLGNHSGVRTAQICLSHGFGDGKEQSCELTKQAVENLLPGVQIDFYLAMNMDGISALNDWAGGVTVTLEDDFTAVDPAMSAGKTLTLSGDQAETFVRIRRQVGEGTNAARMQRQRVYLDTLAEMLKERISKSESEIGSLYDALEPYLTTDIPRGRLINEVWAARDYQTGSLSLQGEHTVGKDGFMQYLADESAVQSVILELFYDRLK